jgi:hypothetical protein
VDDARFLSRNQSEPAALRKPEELRSMAILSSSVILSEAKDLNERRLGYDR